MAFKMKGFNPGQGTGMARNMSKNMSKKKDYVPQTKSRKNIKSDITPQTVKDNMMSRVSKATAKSAKSSARVALSSIANRVNKNTKAKSPNKKKKFPDLNKDGKVTQADVLMGRGVINSPNKKKEKIMVDNTGPARARREKARLKKEREDKRAKATTFVDKTSPARAQREKARLKKASAMKKIDPPATQAKIKKMIIAGIEKGKDDRDILKKVREMSDGNVEYTYNRKTKEVKVYPKGRSGFEGELETDPDKG